MRFIGYGLTAQERANVLRAIHFLRARIGSWIATGKAMRMRTRTLRRIRAGHVIQPYVALRVAKLVAVSVADIKTGKYPPPGTCPNCGHPPTP